jgi:hypothetical protein
VKAGRTLLLVAEDEKELAEVFGVLGMAVLTSQLLGYVNWGLELHEDKKVPWDMEIDVMVML